MHKLGFHTITTTTINFAINQAKQDVLFIVEWLTPLFQIKFRLW